MNEPKARVKVLSSLKAATSISGAWPREHGFLSLCAATSIQGHLRKLFST
jgi:hypothetical protein